jgi:hypothetical protein
MQKVTSYLQTILSWAFVGAVLMTLIAPSISRLLISAPVSFGVNCEPAANWSMSALIRSQLIGLILGGVSGIFASIYFRKSKSSETVGNQA